MKAEEFGPVLRDVYRAIEACPIASIRKWLREDAVKLELHREELEAAETGKAHIPLVCERCLEIVDAVYDAAEHCEPPPGTEAAEKGEEEITCDKCSTVIPDGVDRYSNALKQQFCMACCEANQPLSTEARLEALEEKRIATDSRLSDALVWVAENATAIKTANERLAKLESRLDVKQLAMRVNALELARPAVEAEARLGQGAAPAGVTPEEHAAMLKRLDQSGEPPDGDITELEDDTIAAFDKADATIKELEGALRELVNKLKAVWKRRRNDD